MSSTWTAKSLKRASFCGIRGVDFSSSVLDVSQKRASDMENMICDFGINRKRNGWCEFREFSDEYGNRLRINGIFRYVNGETAHTIIHAGTRFYRMTENGYERIGNELAGLTDTRSQAFLSGKRMYIIGCGDYLVYGTWDGENYELRRVYGDEDTYIPATTINIGCNSSDTARPNDPSDNLDDVNMLTPWRINRLNGCPANTDDPMVTYGGKYWLDGPIDFGTKVTIRKLVTGEEYEAVPKTEFTLYFGSEEAGTIVLENYGKMIFSFDEGYELPSGIFYMSPDITSDYDMTLSDGKIMRGNREVGSYSVSGRSITVIFEDEKEVSRFYGYYRKVNIGVKSSYYSAEIYFKAECGEEISITDEYGGEIGTVKPFTVDFREGSVSVSAGFPVEEYGYNLGEDMFEVQFSSTPTSEDGDFVPYSERVTRCSFGVLFGIEGNTDRLFLSGNPHLPNVDFYSEADDYTYFSDLATVSMGSDSIPVTGYARLSDGTLAVFKDRANAGEATIFYRTGYYKEYTNSDGSLDRIDSVFPTKAGNIGESMISRYASVDFGGDNLILSRNGVFGIELGNNVATANRYTRERSRTVNARLTKEPNLEEAVGICFDGRYYLAVNGHCYVADSRYRYTPYDARDSAWSYEWWYFTNIPARVFAEIGGELWFGSDDGMLCRFDGEFTDRTYTLYEAGDLTFDSEKITVNGTIDPPPAVGDRFLTQSELYGAKYAGFSGLKDGKIIGDVCGMADGDRVIMHGAEGSDVLVNGEEYTVGDIDPAEGCFRLYKEGEAIFADVYGFSLLVPLKGLSLTVTEVFGQSFRVGLFEGSMALTSLNPISLSGKLIHRRNVSARLVSAVTDLGSALYGKTLLRLSVTLEPGIRGKCSFGYTTRLSGSVKDAQGGSGIFSLSDVDFNDFSFESGFASSYSVRIHERDVGYLAVKVESDSDTDCAVNAIEILYRYGRLSGGLR